MAGGRKRQVRVLLQPEKLAARRVTVLDMERALKGANVNVRAGTMDVLNSEILVDAGPFLKSVEEVKDLVLGVSDGKPSICGMSRRWKTDRKRWRHIVA